MSENNSISDESYSDDDEEEELDPRIQDELEKLNAATNSINHLEAELDEARAVFRQTLAGATYQLNGVAQKLGKCVEKSRPFYEAYRQLRQSHGMLQRSTNQFERATGMHVAAKTRVAEAERRVFGGGSKRAFDSALQEMLNQATIEVNEAEKMKRDSWKKHQEDLRAYRDLEAKVKQLYKKLKNSVDKAKPYFEQKKEFDRHLWQLKLRVDSIHLGLSGAKENYSACLKSLEVISDEIHEKRKSKRMEAMIAKLQEREAGVGADSSTEDETSLSASNLDLDFDSNVNFDKLDGISDSMSLKGDEPVGSTVRAVAGCENFANASSSFPSVPLENRIVYGLESPEKSAGLESTENKSGTSSLHLANRESSLEEPSHPESAGKSEGEQSVVFSNEQTSGTEDLVNIQSTPTDLPQEGESISTSENETTQEEICKQDEETTSDDFCVTIAVDDMVSSDTMEGEGSATVTDETLTTRVETESERTASIDEESDVAESQAQSESQEAQNEKANETDVARNEGQNDTVLTNYNSDEFVGEDENDVKNVNGSRDSTTEPTGKRETSCDTKSNEKAEQRKDVSNDENDDNAENITEEKETIDSDIKEKVETDKEITDDDNYPDAENITGEKETIDCDIKEKVETDKEVTDDDNYPDAENITGEKEIIDSDIKEKVETDKEVTDDDNDPDAENNTGEKETIDCDMKEVTNDDTDANAEAKESGSEINEKAEQDKEVTSDHA